MSSIRHYQVTHTYVIEVGEDEDNEHLVQSALSRGSSYMENVIRREAQKATDIHTDWKVMPRAYTRGVLKERVQDEEEVSIMQGKMIDPELVGEDSVNFAQDVMGQSPEAPHPWDQGLKIFPEGHPMRALEDAAFATYMEDDLNPQDQKVIRDAFTAQQVKELSEGE